MPFLQLLSQIRKVYTQLKVSKSGHFYEGVVFYTSHTFSLSLTNAFHRKGGSGPVKVGYFGYLHEACSKWIESCRALGVPLSPDVNNAKTGTLGVTKVCPLCFPVYLPLAHNDM